MASVDVYTVPSTWIRPPAEFIYGAQELMTERPFERIVGMKAVEGYTLWTPPELERDAGSAYEQSDVNRDTLTLPEEQVDRFQRFFTRFMMHDSLRSGDYNCHIFAAWMTDRYDPRKFDQHAASRIIWNGKRQQELTLRAGRHAVVGAPSGRSGLSRLDHSVIGLGKDRDEWLQVMGTRGHLGIANCEDVLNDNLAWTETDAKRSATTYGLYAIPEGAERTLMDRMFGVSP